MIPTNQYTNYPFSLNPQQYQQLYQPQLTPQQIQAYQQNLQAQQAQQIQPAPQIQNGGFLAVRNIEEARNYPVAPGNSITFKDENAPYVYTKTMGFSSLERPVFEKYRLVKEDIQTAQEAQEAIENAQVQNSPNYALREEIEPLRQGFEVLKNEVVMLKEQLSESTPKKITAKAKKEEKDGEE